jgi:putative ABC transport system permease protein
LTAVRAVSSASIVSTIPFIGAQMWQLTVVGRPPVETRPGVSFVRIGGGYFETLGLRLLQGRAFEENDGAPGHESAIVTQRFVEMFFAGEDPLGRWIELTNPAGPGATLLRARIVGVSPTVRQQFLAEIDPVVFVPFRTNPAPNSMLMVRGRSDASAMTSVLRAELRALDPDLPAGQLTAVEEWVGQSRWGHRVFGTMFSLFAMIALAVSALGLYAVTAYSVTQRTHEIGVRMALGASARHVVWLFARRGLLPLFIGVAIGLGGAFGVGRLIQNMLVRTSPTDPVTFVAIVALLAAVSVLACFWPARRAARLDPVAALRHE